MYSRVESGSDPDNLGHFFDGSGGSYPQIKVSDCDLDITCSSKTVIASGKRVNSGSDNAMKCILLV